jgi:hypothetical protein
MTVTTNYQPRWSKAQKATAIKRARKTAPRLAAALSRSAVTLSVMLVPALLSAQPAINIEKSTNGFDADVAPGPSIAVGSPVTWTYLVTNSGDTDLSDLVLTDDQGVAVDCSLVPGFPFPSPGAFVPGAFFACTATGTAIAGQYSNQGQVTAQVAGGGQVSASDPSHYFGQQGGRIDIEKATNGLDADTRPGPTLVVGDPVTWTYVVSNIGSVALSNVTVTDDQGVMVSCPQSSLAVGEGMTCTATGLAVAGQYENVGQATGEPPGGAPVTDFDPSHYLGITTPAPSIDIEKSTNGLDADSPPGPTVAVGDPVTWVYLVTNTGNVPLDPVSVTDDQLGGVPCPRSSLNPGESMSCTRTGTATAGPYQNRGDAAGTYIGSVVNDSDLSHYLGEAPSSIALEKATNGQDADTAPGPSLALGDPITWTYEVTNDGQTQLVNVAVTDDQGVAVTCPQSNLAPGESMTCTATGTAVAGQYQNVGEATALSPGGIEANASDPSHYFGGAPQPLVRLEKATNGVDADVPPGPSISQGASISWTYEVTNVGSEPLTNVTVVDDQGITVTCPATDLALATSMVCQATGTAVPGPYANLGTVTADSALGAVSDSDPSHYTGVTVVDLLVIEVFTNGDDADVPPGPTLTVGTSVTWTYVVTNNLAGPLTQITVTDDQGVTVSCPQTTLAAGESMTCTAQGVVAAGQYANVGTVSGTDPSNRPLSDSDPSHYFGAAPVPALPLWALIVLAGALSATVFLLAKRRLAQ